MTSALSLAMVITFFSCSSSDKSKDSLTKEFDLPKFFRNEVAALNALQPKIRKTVSKDNISETKQLVIADWNKELANFLTIDLNKPAYKGAFTKDSSANGVRYTFIDSTLDLSLVQVIYKADEPSTIIIKKSTKNLLYNTSEHLEYVKGERYSVEKEQFVKALGNQYYKIEGLIE